MTVSGGARGARRAGGAIAALLVAALALVACQSLRLGDGLAGATDVPPPPAGAVRIATHNAHYIDLRAADGPWSLAGWNRRRDALDAAFKALGADAVAFQEMESFAGGSVSRRNLALDFLLARNPGYRAVAVGDPDLFPSTQPILYRAERLEALDAGWFHFSETPDVAYSRGFDGASPSFASWARLRDRDTGNAFTLVNVHFDYGSWENRRRAAELVAERIGARVRRGERVVLAGDANARAGSPTLAILEGAGLAFAPVAGATYHLNRGLNLFGAIDHVALGPGVALAGRPRVLRARFPGAQGPAWPSDHYPVAVDVALE